MNKLAGMIALLLAMAVLSTAAVAETMDEEIDYLLATVGGSNCTFIRNGTSFTSGDAQKHLQFKRMRGKRYFSSADEFIARIASKSSMSGDPYYIQCGDVARQPSGEWFAALLAKHRKK